MSDDVGLTLLGYPARLTVDVDGHELDVSAAVVVGSAAFPGGAMIDPAVVLDAVREDRLQHPPPAPGRVVNFRVPEELDRWAREEAERRGVTVSDVVRAALVDAGVIRRAHESNASRPRSVD